MLRLAFDFIITWRETRTRPNAYILRAVYFRFSSSWINQLKKQMFSVIFKEQR